MSILGPTIAVAKAPIGILGGVNLIQIGAGVLVAALAVGIGKRLYHTVAGDGR